MSVTSSGVSHALLGINAETFGQGDFFPYSYHSRDVYNSIRGRERGFIGNEFILFG